MQLGTGQHSAHPCLQKPPATAGLSPGFVTIRVCRHLKGGTTGSFTASAATEEKLVQSRDQESVDGAAMIVSTAEPSDETLAARAAAGDDSAFEAIVQRYQTRVFRLACRLTSDTDAPDVLQETFLQIYRHLASFRGESQFGTWVYQIASNAALMHRRGRARRPAEPLEAFLPRFDADGRHVASPAELQVASRADELLDRQFLAEKAREVLARLPELYRDAFVLGDLEELPTADVARALGVAPATVRQRVHRARLMLRGYLSDLVGIRP
jgi:RNA polymerase sigma-70 factor, ECF subfamily